MTNPSRARRSLALLLPLAGLLVAPSASARNTAKAAAVAADPAGAEQVPWLYRGSDVPPDREWTFGELPNGVRYAVRHNGVPPGQVSIRVRVDAGSLYEQDSERGYAHLLEHMLFRQSKYIAEGSAITSFQRLGASFGSDTNAETTTTQTVFKLDLPEANAGSLDQAMMLLSGMVTAPTLSASNLKSDLPIVLAEMRERGGAAKRIQQARQEVLYTGQPLAEREPIGTVETLTAATPQSVRAFYERWYRPQNVVVILSGDLPVAELEAAVAKWYGGWKPTGKAVPQPTFGDPVVQPGSSGANPVDETKVLVEPDLPPTLMYAVLRPWRQKNDTIVYNQGKMVDALALAIINRRLETKARAGGSFLSAQVDRGDVARSADVTFVSLTPLTDDWKASLSDVRGVIADAMQSPPTQAEIDREVAELDVAYQVPVEQRRILPGSQLADDVVTALDIRETVASPEAVLDIFRSSKPLFTPKAVLDHTRRLFDGTVTRALFTTQTAGNATDAELQLALQEKAVPAKRVDLAAAPVSFEKLPPIGKAAEPQADISTGLLGIQEVVYANGVKALLWPVKEEPGRVVVKVRFGGGYRAIDAKDAPYIALGRIALVSSGLATLDQDDLDRISTGRKMGFDFDIEDATFQFQAETRPSDLADQLYLFAGKLALPRWDEQPFQRAKAAARIQYTTFATSPQGVLNRDLQFYQRGMDPRFATPTPQQIEATTFARFRDVWTSALAQGPVEVQIYGDFDKASAIAALNRTFGALPARAPQPAAATASASDVAASKPSSQPVVLYHHGDPDQAAAVISWPTGGGSMGISESRQLELLTQLFTNRLLDAAREKLGVSYSPYVYSSWPVDLRAGGSITAMAQVDPKSVPTFFQVASDIAQNLIDNPPSAEELALVTEPMRQQVTRAASSTAFFMNQLEGATGDPVRFGTIGTILTDYTQTTPARMQALAARYLGKGNSWKLEVLPAEDTGKVAAKAPDTASGERN